MAKRFSNPFESIFGLLKTAAEVNIVAHGFGISISAVVLTGLTYIKVRTEFLKVLPDWAVIYLFISAPIIPFLIATWALVLARFRRYRSSEKHFLALASQNAAIDARLFSALYSDILDAVMSSPAIQGELRAIDAVISRSVRLSLGASGENIRSVLERLKMIIDDYTGKPCSTCIKMLIEETQQLVTVERDPEGLAKRGTALVQPADSNTAFEKIMRDGKRHYAANDLAKLASADEYRNSRENWRELYNSTLVVPIYFPSNKGSLVGFLCIDSLHGHLDNPCCIHYALEVSYRLSAVLFRVAALDTKDELYNLSGRQGG